MTADELRDLVDELTTGYDDGRRDLPLLARLRELSVPGRDTPDDGRPATSRKPASRPPVGPAFFLITDLEAAARDLEAEAREALGHRRRRRPASAVHSFAALGALPDLVAGLPNGHPLIGETTREVRRWHRQTRELLGLAERWTRVQTFSARDSDEKVTAACPYCRNASLRRRPTDAAVVCCTPGCKDDGGRRPEWTVDDLVRLGLVLRS